MAPTAPSYRAGSVQSRGSRGYAVVRSYTMSEVRVSRLPYRMALRSIVVVVVILGMSGGVKVVM